MSERVYPSRNEIAKRIGAASQIESQLGDTKYGCVPMTIAFTHGYTEQNPAHGLTQQPKILQIIEGARYIANTYGQELEQNRYDLRRITIDEELSNTLAESDSAWVGYATGESRADLSSHLIGIIPTALGEYIRLDVSRSPSIAKVDIKQLLREISESHSTSLPFVYIFGFSTPDKKHEPTNG